MSFYCWYKLSCGFEFNTQYFVNISWIIHTCMHHSHPLKFLSTAKLGFGVPLEWPTWYFFWLANWWFKHERVHWIRSRFREQWSEYMLYNLMLYNYYRCDTYMLKRDCVLCDEYLSFYLKLFSFSLFRRIYPPDDKTLLEKYESLLATAFQTFLAGRAASLQREMNNPLKRMKVLKYTEFWL